MAKNTEFEMSNLKSKISNLQSLRVLMVEDSEDDALLIIRELKKGGYNPVYERVETAAAMKKTLKEKQWDIILSDYKMPKFSGTKAIAVLKETNIDIPLIIVSGAIGEETAVECMRLGAHDYIMKNNLSRLCPAITRELEEAASRSKRKQAEEALRQSEEKYRNLVERANDGICIVQEGILRYTNARLAQIGGYSVEELTGKSFTDFFTPEEVPKVLDRYKRRMAGKDVAPIYETALKHNDGSRVDIEINAGVITYEGKPADLALVRDITERKQTEDALRQSEEKYRNILENMQDGYFELDLVGNYTFANNAECRNIGYPKEELIGMNFRQYQDETNAQKMYQFFRRLVRTGEPVKAVDVEIIRKNGTKGFDEVSASLIRDAEGKPIGFRGISRDITERKQEEEALRESEERYHTMFENTGTSMILVEEDMTISMANGEFVRSTGYSPDEIIGRMKWTEIVHPDDLGRMVEQHRLRRESQRGALPGYEFRYRTKSGDLRDTLLTVDVLPGTRKSIASLIDITERKRAEEKLRRSEEKYRSLVENAQEGIFQSTAEGHHITINQAFANMLGYESPEEVMATIADIPHQVYVHPDDRTKILQIIEKEGSVKGYEAEFYKKDGSKTWVSINMHAVRDEEGRLLYYQGIDQDITEKKKIEAERQENIERLRKSLGVTINAISMIVEMKDPYTSGHQQRVSDLARSIATEMGLSADRQDFLRTASAIHDIGKISVPSEILSKPTKLTDLEFSLIKTHVRTGYDILKDIEFPWPVADVVLQHHERMDGSGYPQGLKGDDILLEARILAVADVVEAIASHRPYRPELGIDFALEEISGNKGILYDADAVDACLKLFREKGYTLVLKKS